MCRAVLRDSLYFILVTVYAWYGNGIDIRAELDGVHFASASNVHGDFDLHFAWRGRITSFRRRTRFSQASQSCGRILFRVANRLPVVEFGERRSSRFQTLRDGEYFNRNADNLRGRNNFNDFNARREFFGGNNNGGLAVYYRRHHKSGGGGNFGRQVAKNFRAVINMDIAKKIIAGERLKPSDDLEFLLTTPLEELQAGARLIRQKFFGNHVDLCTIINGKSGHCSEDCKYCAQSVRHKTNIDEYDFLPTEKILAVALANEKAGVNRFSIVTSGRLLDGKNFERAIETYKALRGRLKIDLCASHGILNAEQLK